MFAFLPVFPNFSQLVAKQMEQKNYITCSCPEDFIPSLQLMIQALMTSMLDEWNSELAFPSHRDRVKWLSSSSMLSMANNYTSLLLGSTRVSTAFAQNSESNSKFYYHSLRMFRTM